jgi:hypothetical protein
MIIFSTMVINISFIISVSLVLRNAERTIHTSYIQTKQKKRRTKTASYCQVQIIKTFLHGTSKVIKILILAMVTSQSEMELDSSIISITLPNGDKCLDPNTQKTSFYQTTLEISCDRNIERITVDNPELIDLNKCQNLIKMRSQHACGLADLYISNSINENSGPFGLIMIIAGLYFCFMGYKHLQLTRILTGVSLVMLAVFFFLANDFQGKLNIYSFWGLFVLSFLGGLVLGWIICYFPYLVSCLLGGLLGFVFTELFYGLLLGGISSNPRTVYYVILALFTIIGLVYGCRYPKHVFIISCAYFGSFIIIKGFTFMDGKFSDEQQIFGLIEKGEWPQVRMMLNFNYYISIVLSFFLGIAGIWHQFRWYFKDIRDDMYSDFGRDYY